MRLFQNAGVAPRYRREFDILAADAGTFAARRAAFIADRYGAAHFLKPVLDGDRDAFMTNGDDMALQAMWAREHGLRPDASAQAVLLAQIEAHRTEVFYNLDPMRFGSDFVRKLPGCVRRRIAWRAAPSPGADFNGYDLVVCNFPSILRSWTEAGYRSAWFAPAHDPVLDAYVGATDRPIDVVFFGGYSRHHRARGALLETIAHLAQKYSIRLHLDRSRLTRLAESPLGLLGPLAAHRRPKNVRRASRPPLFGRALYKALSEAKIVFNAAVDMAGDDRGNMRCWEATGAGAMLVTDQGNYPDGFTNGKTIATYGNANDLAKTIERAVSEPQWREQIAAAGAAIVRQRYDKASQWRAFVTLAS